ncbi:MAG: hypothetical protein Q9227_008099 [Pyrenula ochraceoflavens]
MHLAQRCKLLRIWSTPELAEIQDIRNVFRQVVSEHICPSSSQLRAQLYQDGDAALLGRFQASLTPTISQWQTISVPVPSFHTQYSSRSLGLADPSSLVNSLGFGDDIGHYYLVEDMLKLSPDVLLDLLRKGHSKWVVQAVIETQGEWFNNNGEVWAMTFEQVMRDRGEDVEAVHNEIQTGKLGITRHDRCS